MNVGMVRDYLIDQARTEVNHEMDKRIDLTEIKAGAIVGGYQKIQQLLPYLLPTVDLKPGQEIHLKLEGDGRKVGKTKKQTMMSFCLLDQGKKVLEPDNRHVLSITLGGESY